MKNIKIPTIRSTKLFLFNMVGTLYLEDRLFDFTIPLLRKIRKTGGCYLFMINNSSKGVENYIRNLRKLGILSTREILDASDIKPHYVLVDAGEIFETLQ